MPVADVPDLVGPAQQRVDLVHADPAHVPVLVRLPFTQGATRGAKVRVHSVTSDGQHLCCQLGVEIGGLAPGRSEIACSLGTSVPARCRCAPTASRGARPTEPPPSRSPRCLCAESSRIPGQDITIRAIHRDTGNYTALDTPPASTRGLTAKWHKGIQIGNGAFSRTGVMVVAV
jgi:hypothetical protein